MNVKKTAISAALTAVMGAGVTGGAMAANIVTMDITDWDSDGIAGGFAFASGTSTTGKYTHFFDSTTTSVMSAYGAASNGDGLIQADGLPEGTQSFTAGFTFNGYGFKPSTQDATGTGTAFNPSPAGGIAGTVSAAGTSSNTVMNMSEFTWAGAFGTSLFPLSPDSGFSTNLAFQGAAGCAIGSSNVCYQLRWEHFISPQGGFSGDTVWQIEGIATLDANVTLHAVPVPAAVWLFGSGLLGLVGVARRKRA